jgi:hypothetical protein
LGYGSNRDLLAEMKDAEGFDAAGHSAVYYRLLSQAAIGTSHIPPVKRKVDALEGF